MLRMIVLTCVVAACASQGVDPKAARILKEQRFNAGDGRAGAAFATEDGHVFREESDAAGNRIGQYSYVGDDGQTYTVRYSAGKEGFRILSGDHIPSGGQDAAAFVAELPSEEPLPAPVQQTRPVERPQFRAQPQPQPQQFQPRQPEPQAFAEAPVDPNRNPFINPHDPTHRNFQFNKNGANFDPNNPLSRQQNLVPNCADCEGINPFINPFDSTHSAALAGHLAGHGAGQQRQQRPRPAPRRPAPKAPIAPVQTIPQQQLRTTQRPAFVFPPGQLKLNRFETGFNFDFES